MNKHILFITGILMFCCKISVAQIEISAGSGYNLPLGELKWIYSPALSYSLALSKVKERKKSRNALGLELGYMRFQPKDSVFYYLLSEEEYGTVNYSNYQIYQLSAVIRHDFILSEHLSLFIGSGFGYYYVNFQYNQYDPYVTTEGQTIEGKFAVSPRVGISVNFNKSIGVFLHSQYNFMLSVGSLEAGSASYNSNTGSYNYYLSHVGGLYFRF